jgi:hypothetical protein
VYVGNRTDGSDTCGVGDPLSGVSPCPHPHPGILIEDVSDPSTPTNAGEIGPPYAGNVGISTRELRVWPQEKLLIVMSFRCSAQVAGRACGQAALDVSVGRSAASRSRLVAAVHAFDLIRNGLYILRYTGRRAGEVGRIRFVEGNSNLGDAVRLGDTRP